MSGLHDIVRYMFNQIEWGHIPVARHPTYHNLKLKFLSSFHYYLHKIVGKDKGINIFRLFGHDYQFNHTEIGDLLGFQTGPDTFVEVPDYIFMQYELDDF